MRNSLLSSVKNKNQVDVLFSFNADDNYARPVRVTWNGEEHWLGGVQFWYAEHRGGTLVHHYRVSDEPGDYTFELAMETENLTWSLEKVTEHRPQPSAGQVLAGAAA